MDSTRHAGRTAIVTGAASGIGRALAHRLAAEGASVVATDRHADDLAETAGSSDRISTVVADLSEPDAAEAIVGAAAGKVDILANIAGVFDNFTPLDETEDSLWDFVLAVNVTAPMRLARAVIPLMSDAGGGVIVNLSSVAGLSGGNGGVSYTASKHAMVGLTRHITSLYGDRGIRCNAICPAGVGTNLTSNALGAMSPWVMERLGPTSLGRASRIAEADEIAALASFLASDEAVNINGAAIATDDGWTAI